MKIKVKKALEARKARYAAGTNNGWLNFLIAKECGNCLNQEDGAYCSVREATLTREGGCVKKAYEAKKAKND